MYCPKCGKQNDDNAYKCTKCGIILQQVPTEKKKNAALIVLVVAAIAFVFIVVMGILAAIAIPAFVNYQTKARNAMAQAEIKNACQAATAFFVEHPDKTITVADLKERGSATNPDVELSIENGTMEGLSIRAKHSKGNRVYVADRNCTIQEIRP
jgi:Tfp pilus assembly protein PilE